MAVTAKHSEAGFTLVEILCVLALLGLTAGLVVLNLPKPSPPFKAEITGAASLLNLAARESVIDGKTRGVDFTASSLEILKYDGEWVSEFQQDFTYVSGLEVMVDQSDIDLADRAKKKAKAAARDDAETLPPLIYFDATGNVTPFIISVRGNDERFTIEPDMRGRIILETAP